MYVKFFKPVFDICFASVLIVVLSPLFLILTISGFFMMKGNPFFVQKRPGKNEKIFKMIKFRTMTNKQDKNGIFLADNNRLTSYGKFLRDTSLDELPGIINVLLGNMSFVGPRPQLILDMVFMTPEQRKRHTVMPGITGLAQCNGRNAISWERKFEYDLKYIQHISFLGDLKIILKTAAKVVLREGVSSDGIETSEDLGDYLLRTGKIGQDVYNKLREEAKKISDV